MVVINLTKEEDFNGLMTGNDLVVVHFYADWAEECKNMNDVLDELAVQADLKDVKFTKILAEDFPEISMKHKIEAVPTFLLFRGGNQVDRVDGANAADLTQKVRKHAGKILPSTANSKPVEEQDLNVRLKTLINQSSVMLFMKGSPQEPKCGFSRQMITLLDSLKTSYKTFDILQDNAVREGLKVYSKWPTYPQLYVNGELVGGLDIAKELVATGELQDMLPKELENRIKSLINRSDIMLFMKGTPVKPRCGFSEHICQTLREVGTTLKSSGDNASPCLKPMIMSDDSEDVPSILTTTLVSFTHIWSGIANDRKRWRGTADKAKTLPVLLSHRKAKFDSYDVLQDPELREGLKKYSDWPTYPQLYVKGVLLGGDDIVYELHSKGELKKALHIY